MGLLLEAVKRKKNLELVSSKQIARGPKERKTLEASRGRNACKVEKWALLLPSSFLFFLGVGYKKKDSSFLQLAARNVSIFPIEILDAAEAEIISTIFC